MSERKHRVFVYGTLKRGVHNHRLLETSDYRGEAVTIDTFKMFTTGFPVVFMSIEPGAKHVIGEVYDVDDETLKRLDQLEAEGHMYDRKTVDVFNNQDNVVDASVAMYIGNPPYWKGHKMPEYTSVNTNGELDWKSAHG